MPGCLHTSLLYLQLDTDTSLLLQACARWHGLNALKKVEVVSGTDPDCQILIRALHKLQLLFDGPLGVLLEHILCLMHPQRANPGCSRKDLRACVVNVAVLHDMLAEQLLDILISAVESLIQRPTQKQKAWDRLAADWSELDPTQWRADPVAAVLAARAAAADTLLREGELSVEDWQPTEDPRLPSCQRYEGLELLQAVKVGHAACW